MAAHLEVWTDADGLPVRATIARDTAASSRANAAAGRDPDSPGVPFDPVLAGHVWGLLAGRGEPTAAGGQSSGSVSLPPVLRSHCRRPSFEKTPPRRSWTARCPA